MKRKISILESDTKILFDYIANSRSRGMTVSELSRVLLVPLKVIEYLVMRMEKNGLIHHREHNYTDWFARSRIVKTYYATIKDFDSFH